MVNSENNVPCEKQAHLVGNSENISTQKTLLGYRLHEILGHEIEAKLFEKCQGECRNTGECTADCSAYPAEDVIDELINEILRSRISIKSLQEQVVWCAENPEKLWNIWKLRNKTSLPDKKKQYDLALDAIRSVQGNSDSFFMGLQLKQETMADFIASVIECLKILPTSLQEETIVLGSMMLNPIFLFFATTILFRDDFSFLRNQIIFDILVDSRGKNKALTALSVYEIIKEKGLEGIVGLSDIVAMVESVHSTDDGTVIITTLIEKSKKRKKINSQHQYIKNVIKKFIMKMNSINTFAVLETCIDEVIEESRTRNEGPIENRKLKMEN